MKMSIDRDLCNHVLPECERCFARMMVNPLGEDRPCVTLFEDDGDPTLYLTIAYDSNQRQDLVLEPEERALVANLGWSEFVETMPQFYRE